MAFKIAGSMAFKDGCKKASPALLEPVMRVEVVLPEEYMGDGERRFEFAPRPHRRNGSASRARRSSSRSFRCRRCSDMRRSCVRARRVARRIRCIFGQYEEVPKQIAEEIIAKAQGSDSEKSA